MLVELCPKHKGVPFQSGPWNNILVVNLWFLFQPFLSRKALLGGLDVDEALRQGVRQSQCRRFLVAYEMDGGGAQAGTHLVEACHPIVLGKESFEVYRDVEQVV